MHFKFYILAILVIGSALQIKAAEGHNRLEMLAKNRAEKNKKVLSNESLAKFIEFNKRAIKSAKMNASESVIDITCQGVRNGKYEHWLAHVDILFFAQELLKERQKVAALQAELKRQIDGPGYEEEGMPNISPKAANSVASANASKSPAKK